MPSGHSVGALAWLLIAVRAARRWVWALTGMVAVLIAVSRIYLGAHFPSQVLVGLMVGAALLVAFVRFESAFLAWFAGLSLGQRLGTVAVVTTLLLGLGWVSVAAVGDEVPEAAWVTNAAGQIDDTEPFEPADGSDVASTVGIFAGTAAGLVLLAHLGGFHSTGTVVIRVLRFVLGLVVVVAVLAVVGVIGGALGLDDGEGTGGVIWEFASTAAAGLAVFFFAPFLFTRLRLTTTSITSQSEVSTS